MKKISLLILSLILLLSAFALFSCEKEEEATVQSISDEEEIPKEGLWQNATYRKNTTLGEGSTSISVTVEIENKSLLFTVKTDEKTVGAALQKVGLVTGEDGPYGLYIKTVNGVLADYDVDKSYWSFYINNEYANTGVDKTNIENGVSYKLKYEKEN